MRVRITYKDITIEVEDNKVVSHNVDLINLIIAMSHEMQQISKRNENGNATNVRRVDDSRVHDTNDIDNQM